MPLSELVTRLLETVADEAARLGCEPALQRLPSIFADGTSAHAQVRLYNERRAAGDSRAKALRHVVEWLVDTTARPTL